MEPFRKKLALNYRKVKTTSHGTTRGEENNLGRIKQLLKTMGMFWNHLFGKVTFSEKDAEDFEK